MFKNCTITLGEAVNLNRSIVSFLSGFDIINFNLSHRLKRQLKKLALAEERFNEAQTDILTTLVGEDRFDEIKTSEKPIRDYLSDSEMESFEDLFNKELKSDFVAPLLTEDFSYLIGDAEIDKNLALIASDIIDFLEEKSFS